MTTRVAKDTAFLREVAKVFAKYPGVKHRYALASLAIPLEMGIDFDKQIGVCRSEGDKVVIEFQDRGEDSKLRMRHCDVQNEDGTCQAWSGELAE
ncbi:MAG: hypothetical protein JF597_34475 [Streptomyces sp.]|uniref:hypothetical protein n=1 Tax=Streptomyces sp. TaxID=1931 RepID=UPI0025E7E2F5|nr:hypothetical protein [Streptomyces sp.]MBW8798499.1 hypothetical protein [Streptomyces sp.]